MLRNRSAAASRNKLIARSSIRNSAGRWRRAAARYEESLKAFAADAKAPLGLPERLRRDLRAAARRLEIVLGDNSRLVAANREAGTRLIGRIIEAASQNPAAGGYTAAGKLAVEPAAATAFGERV